MLAMAAALLLCVQPAAAEEPVHRIGVLFSIGDPEIVDAWHKGLRDYGYIEGRNLLVEYRFHQNRPERIAALAAELAALEPELIVTSSPQPALAVRAAAPKTPLVFVAVGDPVGLGLVESFAHPGGNATGLAAIVIEGFNGKQLQLLREMVPSASQIAVLINPLNPAHQRAKSELPEIGRQLSVTLIVVEASGLDTAETAFNAASKQGAEAIEIWGDQYIWAQSSEIVALAERYRLPAGYFLRRNVLDGGLLSLGPNQAEFWTRAADYVDKILKGEHPADLTVERPTGYHLAVNLKTAAALGIAVPPSILTRADEVIE
jgi:putative ABC transport system substrate-binding protein